MTKFTGTLAVSSVLLMEVVPPVPLIANSVPGVPAVRSQARYVSVAGFVVVATLICTAGMKRNKAVLGRRKADASDTAGTFDHVTPLTEYCQLPGHAPAPPAPTIAIP